MSVLAVTYPHSRIFADLLVATSIRTSCRILGYDCDISTRHVLAHAWNPGRLADCADRLAAGETAPPIQATRYRLGSSAWYVLSDGNHRSVAAQQASRQTIRAHVDAEYICDPHLFYIDRSGRLWRRTSSEGGASIYSLAGDGWQGEHLKVAQAHGVRLVDI